ncbi:MAG: aminotransferase, partial [Ruminococcus sp.]|nr:aminotransferase [Ruminococcus sp.]
MYYSDYSKEQLLAEKESLKAAYKKFLDMGLRLDMSRGKPCAEQLDISVHMLDIVNSEHDCKSKTGLDCRNYGLLEGLPSCRELFAKLMQVKPEEV